jgi:hypothetical protein
MLLGASVALVLRRSPSLQDEVLSWPLLVLLAFQALVVTPVATLLFRFYPQWSMFYWFDPQIFPEIDAYTGMLSAIAVACNGLAAIAGFLVVRHSVVKGPAWLRWLPFGLVAAAIAWALVVFPRRLVFIGDYDEFWRGEAHVMVARLGGWVGIATYALAATLVLVLRQRYANREPKIV